MNQRLLFEYSPAFILACLAIGVGYAWLLYRAKATWSRRANQFLFVLRAILVFFLQMDQSASDVSPLANERAWSMTCQMEY